MPPKKRSTGISPSYAAKSTPTSKPKLKPKPRAARKPKSPAKTPTRPSKRTKPDPTTQIRAAFTSYADTSTSIISVPDVSRALRVLKYPLPPPDFFDAEQEEEGLGFDEFLELATTLRESQDSESDSDSDIDVKDEAEGDDEIDEAQAEDAEITDAFALFTQFQPQYKNLDPRERRITMQDLRRIAAELKEEVDEKTLRLMIEEANGEVGDQGVRKGVGVADFGDVMRRCGAVGR